MKKYWCSKYTFRKSLFDTIILIHKDKCQNPRISEVEVPGIMNNSMKIAEFEKFGHHFGVGNIHLQMTSSLGNNIALRSEQLKAALKVMTKFPQKLLCGDFNFDASSEHNQ